MPTPARHTHLSATAESLVFTQLSATAETTPAVRPLGWFVKLDTPPSLSGWL